METNEKVPFSDQSVRVDYDIIGFPKWIKHIVDNHIYPSFAVQKYKQFQEERFKQCFYILITNLYQSWSLDLPIRYYRSPNYYRKMNIAYENRMAFTASRVCKCIDFLKDEKYISFRLGRQGIKNQYRGFMSQSYAKELLVKLFENYQNLDETCEYSLNPANLIVKDDQKVVTNPVGNDLIYAKQSPTDIMIEMDNINQYYNNTLIELDIRSIDLEESERNILKYMLNRNVIKQTYPGFFRFEKKTAKRIFNNSSYLLGGRMYAIWQNITSRLRQYILLNKEPVVELDFKACQPSMLYHVKGLELNTDPYAIDDWRFINKNMLRSMNKLILLIVLNSRNIDSATKALADAIYDDLGQKCNYYKLKKWIQLFIDKHKAIEDQFFSGVGLKLQRLESHIAIKSILQLHQADIPCLSIHDGFVVPQSKEIECRTALIENYKSLFPNTYPLIEKEKF